MCEEARSEDDGPIALWMKKPQSERSMTRGLRHVLLSVGHDKLGDQLLSHMPRKTQQVLGMKDLKPIDLLGMPQAPAGLLHRLVYLDVPVRAGSQNIRTQPAIFSSGAKSKALKAGTQFQTSMEAKVYVGSAMAKVGGYQRLRTHEREANRPANEREKAMHYAFTGQDDVVPNFLVAAVWSNPHVLPGSVDEDQDIKRWLPVFLEGLLMVYLGTYHRSNRGYSHKPEVQAIFTDASYDLVEKLRCGLQLPDFHDSSLNQAWPLVQGVTMGMVHATQCGNKECQRRKVKAVAPGSEFTTTKRLIALDGPLSLRDCCQCYSFARLHDGLLRTRKGNNSGHFHFELAFNRDTINAAWFAKGNPRRCTNPSCRVSIPEDADIYGFANGMRCKRCHTFARNNKTEWDEPEQEDLENLSGCDSCHGPAPALFLWGQEKLCVDCNTTRCCFGNDGSARPTSPTTIPACANAACRSMKCRLKTRANYVEDIDMNIWRCLICDWSYSVFGVEMPHGLQKAPEEAYPAGPIKHHRYNSTECVECGCFASYLPWIYVDKVGYKCGSCCNLRCANDKCWTSPVLATSRLIWDKDLNGSFCSSCHTRNASRVKREVPKQVRFGPHVIPKDRKCANPACNRTPANFKDWVFEDEEHRGDENFVRCTTCHYWLKEKGVERVPIRFQKGGAPRSCIICSTTEARFWGTVPEVPGTFRCKEQRMP